MKNIIILIIIATCAISTEAWAQQHVGVLKRVTGDVEIQREENSQLARQGIQLFNGDHLISKDKGYAGIMFSDGTTITIGPNSDFYIKNYRFKPEIESYDFSMYLKKGSAIYNSGKIGKLSPASVDLSTPRAIVGVRGTRFIINVE